MMTLIILIWAKLYFLSNQLFLLPLKRFAISSNDHDDENDGKYILNVPIVMNDSEEKDESEKSHD